MLLFWVAVCVSVFGVVQLLGCLLACYMLAYLCFGLRLLRVGWYLCLLAAALLLMVFVIVLCFDAWCLFTMGKLFMYFVC